jgi:hypothetical protein
VLLLKGRLLTLPTNIRLGWKKLGRDKRFSLLQKFVTYGSKKLYNTGPCLPNYRFRVLDSYGWNFREAKYHEEHRRTLYKLYGLKVKSHSQHFIFFVTY